MIKIGSFIELWKTSTSRLDSREQYNNNIFALMSLYHTFKHAVKSRVVQAKSHGIFLTILWCIIKTLIFHKSQLKPYKITS